MEASAQNRLKSEHRQLQAEMSKMKTAALDMQYKYDVLRTHNADTQIKLTRVTHDADMKTKELTELKDVQQRKEKECREYEEYLAEEEIAQRNDLTGTSSAAATAPTTTRTVLQERVDYSKVYRELFESGSNEFQIFVKSPSDDLISMMVSCSTTIGSVRARLAGHPQFPPVKYQLIYAGKMLDPDTTLARANVCRDSTLMSVIGLPAGGKRARSATGSGVKTDTQDKAGNLATMRADITMKTAMTAASECPSFAAFARDTVARRDHVGWFGEHMSNASVETLKELKSSLASASNTPQKCRMISKIVFAEVFDNIATIEHQIRTLKGMPDGMVDNYIHFILAMKYMTNSGSMEGVLLNDDIENLITNRLREEGRIAGIAAAAALVARVIG
jgi:hypothetical protein